MLADILKTFCIESGYDPVNQREAALTYINRAALRIYQSLEADAAMREVVLCVGRNLQVSLPSFVGQPRGMRETFNSGSNFESLGMTIPMFEIGVPRYTSDSSLFRWRNWTLKGTSPIAQTSSVAGPLVFVSAFADPTVNITVSGATEDSNLVAETVNMSAPVVQTINAFDTNKIISITCPTYRQYDIIIQDTNGVELAKLYNNEYKTRYVIMDVAAYPWIAVGGNGNTILAEFLYKAKFTKFFNDTDEFIAEGYDDAIASKALSLTFYGQEGKEGQALGYMQDSMELIDLQTSNSEVGSERKIQHGPNKIYRSFSKLQRNASNRKATGTDWNYWPW